MSNKLTNNNKKCIRKIVKEKYGGKEYNKDKFNKILTEISENNNIPFDNVNSFMDDYTTTNNNKIKLYKIKKRTNNTDINKNNNKKYKYIKENIKKKEYNTKDFGPFGTQWTFDNNQLDDEITPEVKKRTKIFNKLSRVVLPEQRTPEWFEMRSGKITASDGGCVVGVNKYEEPYKFILKKVLPPEFKTNEHCYHGKKYEEIATMIYQQRKNVLVREFGLMAHPKYNFLGASPDGIVCKYKFNGKNLTKYIGRMLEIKCPKTREIKTKGGVLDICPIYYWVQIQLQLECCNLDECDFWQCKLTEYEDREDYIEDTNPSDPYKSLSFGYEKGCVIQLLPRKYMNEILKNKYKYNYIVYDNAKFIYPPKIDMTPMETDIWITETITQLHIDPEYYDYYFDRVLYWRVEKTHNLKVNRDKEWFENKLPEFKKMWDYVLYFRKYPDKFDIINNYIQSMNRRNNNKIMEKIELICNEPNEDAELSEQNKYKSNINKIVEETKLNTHIKNNKNKNKKNNFNTDDYMF
jgi:putative phage-type endonuclease